MATVEVKQPMTRKQMAFIVVLNAVISTLITLLLVLVILPALNVATIPGSTTPTSSVAERITQSAVKSTPTPTPVIHLVQMGDTISGLALKYDVPAEDIIAANNLANPNYLVVGTELIIPVGGLPQATGTFTPEPTVTDTPLPFYSPSEETATAEAEAIATATAPSTPLPLAGELKIVISEIIGVGDVNQERLVILNEGDRLADMQGWTLSDANGNVYAFPNFRLWAGGSATVHTRIGQVGNPPANFYWGKLEAIWSPGEIATLKNSLGEIIATYTIRP
jgi:LysM repeat protein